MKQHLILFKKTLMVTFLLFAPVFYGQPSTGIVFTFKLFDEHGKHVDYERFCTEYPSSLKGFTACTNKYLTKANTYNDATGYLSGSASVVYNNLERIFIHEKDTMTLVLATNGGQRKNYRIDSLYIRHGKYFIEDENLKSVDFEKAAVGYYNQLLQQVLHIKKQIYNYQRRPQYIELNTLKRRYKIALDDDTEKTRL